MAVWYLDSDDEITDAVARMRAATDEQIVFVVPPGSRIATGRINFRLLSREAAARGLRLAIASPDAQVRALATSAGVLGLATAAEAQAALTRGDAPPEVDEAGARDVARQDQADAAGLPDEAVVLATRRRRRRLAATTIVVTGLASMSLVFTLQSVSTARITLAPRLVSVGPLELTVMALPTIDEPDVASRQVPATLLSIPLRVEGEFAASGRETVEERAEGTVVFSTPSQGFDEAIVIPAPTRVFTADGFEFRTTETVTLQPSSDPGTPGQVAAAIEAARPGPDGNVPAGAIESVPSLAERGITATNPVPTSGGRIVETPLVTRQDYEAAAVDLQNRLAGALAAHLRDPANAPPGSTVFEASAQSGPVTVEPPADVLVGSAAADFRLDGAMTARVLAVDEGLAEDMVHGVLVAAVPEGMALTPGSESIRLSEGAAEAEGIRFDGTAQGDAYQLVDVDEVRARIAGLPVSRAQAILEALGVATVNVWPEFLGDLPGDRGRIRIDLLEPSTTESDASS